MNKNTGGPAFPAMVADSYGYGVGFFVGKDPDGSRQFIETFSGMTLRDWFAGQALITLSEQVLVGDESPESLAKCAYALADAMLAERSKQ